MSPGAVWSRRLGAFAFVLLLTVVLSHRYGFVDTPDLPNLLGAVLVVVLAGVLAGAVAHRRYWYFGDRGGSDIAWGFFWALATIAPFLPVAYWYLAYPALNDISTDLENPPALAEAVQLRTAGMNVISPPTPERIITQAENYPLIEGRRYEVPLERVVLAVDGILQRRGWTVTATRDAVGSTFETTIEAVAYSPLLSMPADVAVRLADDGTSSFVDMRSASRYGSHDLGDNAARIAAFLSELDGDMSAQVGVAPVATEPPEDDGTPTVEIPDEAPPPTQAPEQ